MKKSELKARKDSQGYYEVTLYGRIIWDGYAESARQAKNLAMEEREEPARWDDFEPPFAK